MAPYPSPTEWKEDIQEMGVQAHAIPSAVLEDEPLPTKGTPERLLAERKLVRKLDSRVLPTILLIFIMNFIDVRLLLGLRAQHDCSFRYSLY